MISYRLQQECGASIKEPSNLDEGKWSNIDHPGSPENYCKIKDKIYICTEVQSCSRRAFHEIKWVVSYSIMNL